MPTLPLETSVGLLTWHRSLFVVSVHSDTAGLHPHDPLVKPQLWLPWGTLVCLCGPFPLSLVGYVASSLQEPTFNVAFKSRHSTTSHCCAVWWQTQRYTWTFRSSEFGVHLCDPGQTSLSFRLQVRTLILPPENHLGGVWGSPKIMRWDWFVNCNMQYRSIIGQPD